MKKIDKERIIESINNKGFYLVKESDVLNIKIDTKGGYFVTLLNNDYRIFNITCDYCGSVETYITNKEEIPELLEQLEMYSKYYINNGEVICEDCFNDNFFYCSRCDELHRLEDGYETRDDGYVCEDCYYDYYVTCDDCGDIVSRDDYFYIEEEDRCLCMDCYNNYYFRYGEFDTDKEEIIGNIDDFSSTDATCGYHNNPIPFEKRKSERDGEDEQLFFGVELETSIDEFQKKKNASCYIAKNLNCRIETDSSVCGYSMEIISDPQTFKKWEDRRNKIDTIFNNMIDYGVTSHSNNTCGLHIHVSRDGLSTDPVEQERIINNIILILENFKSNFIKLSRREESQLKRWGCFLSDFDGCDKDLRDTKKIKDNYNKYERYVALNLNNDKTIEFRFFRGTLKTSTFYATLQLVKNIIEIARKEDVRGISFKKLINLNGYTDLIDYSKERGCDNSLIIIDKGYMNKFKEMKERNKQLKRYNRYITFKNEILDYLLTNKNIIETGYNYSNRNGYSIIYDVINLSNKNNIYNLIGDNVSKIINYLKYKEEYIKIKESSYSLLNEKDMQVVYNTFKKIKTLIKDVI